MIPKVSLSFSPPGIHTVKQMQWTLVALSIGFILLSGWIFGKARDLQIQASTLQEETTSIRILDTQFIQQAKKEGFEFSEERNTRLVKEVQFANQLQAHQAFSWTQFLTDLESAVPKHISMESVALNYKDGTISLSGSAKSLKDLQALVDGLERHNAFHDVIIAGHKTKTPERKKTRTKPYIVFSMKVGYSHT